jgi:hypothetical protein
MLLILMVCVLLLYFWRTEFFNYYYGVTATRDDVYGDAVQQELFVSLYGTISSSSSSERTIGSYD